MIIMTDMDAAETTNYLLRGAPADRWRLARAKAAAAGKPMRAVILELLDEWVDRDEKLPAKSVSKIRHRRK